ncbi:hypothetical protein LEP1GSC132_2662 [Leptospira kirschneri str. 200803703]|uniref:Uncharacterized protein n=1 Tax=Leptospira kirschneri str. 200802841 TaxID=1193047 RepID=A0A828Y5D2_9LEPT|nr:hypothetical protein LEP1GSC131_4058 [Leptospira kirschneri str. 200802841]EMO68252.1 hypothetical protein LEP1GSC132_2662 [Leptospira kirschneri str. 200803703]EMO78530.1 hypothetical protein LEP1GSC127_2366 [Leptospira kirschneri str. 200801925]
MGIQRLIIRFWNRLLECINDSKSFANERSFTNECSCQFL